MPPYIATVLILKWH